MGRCRLATPRQRANGKIDRREAHTNEVKAEDAMMQSYRNPIFALRAATNSVSRQSVDRRADACKLYAAFEARCSDAGKPADYPIFSDQPDRRQRSGWWPTAR